METKPVLFPVAGHDALVFLCEGHPAHGRIFKSMPVAKHPSEDGCSTNHQMLVDTGFNPDPAQIADAAEQAEAMEAHASDGMCKCFNCQHLYRKYQA